MAKERFVVSLSWTVLDKIQTEASYYIKSCFERSGGKLYSSSSSSGRATEEHEFSDEDKATAMIDLVNEAEIRGIIAKRYLWWPLSSMVSDTKTTKSKKAA